MAKIIQFVTLMLVTLIMTAASCDKGREGCADSNACNYDSNVAIDDNSCWYAANGCDCDDSQGSRVDCLGVCDENIENDPGDNNLDGICNESVIGGCIDSLKCNFDSIATHNNGTCEKDLSVYGGDISGNDCTYPNDGACGGRATIDNCGLCVGGTTSYGQCWQMQIQAITSFKLQNGLSMGNDTSSIIIGASNNALDGYNIDLDDNSIQNCQLNYSDMPGLIKTEMNSNKNNFINFYIPHDGDPGWSDSFGSNFNKDIQANNYQSLIDEERGMNWFSIIEPTMQDTFIVDEYGDLNAHPSILDSIKLEIKNLESIKCSEIKIYFDRIRGEISGGEEYLMENNKFEMKVDTDKSFSIMFNIFNICIQEFEEYCPDEY